jgi:alpha-N-arabinofuranosidase
MTNRILIDRERRVGIIDPKLFGAFLEHMGRAIYEGIYDPQSPFADEQGFRQDVLAALKELRPTVLRYPGGNFVSGYNWLDGVGPRNQRPRKREMAWQSIETNQFGTNEFIEYCRKLGTEPMLAVNLGTGTIDQAAALVEYCNAPTGSYYADLRAEHGYEQPHNVRYWCLGNEMDGPWQIGHLSADEYARKALEAAKVMKWQDSDIQLILCGSSGSGMPTYPEWDRIALEQCWEHVEYLSLHAYADNHNQDTNSYLALAQQFENHLDTLAGTLRYVKAKLRSKHDVFLSWDEWNVWYKDTTSNGRWQTAPHLSEEVYNLEDALVVAQWLNVFLRRCDILKMACIAQLVNVISPILTRPDGLLRQTTFYPFKLFSQYARGIALDVLNQSRTYDTKKFESVPVLDVSASYDEATNQSTVFIVNRAQDKNELVDLVWQGWNPGSAARIFQMGGADPKSVNTFEQPKTVVPIDLGTKLIDSGKLQLSLPPLSLTVLAIE